MLSKGFEKISAKGKAGFIEKAIETGGKALKEAPGVAKATWKGMSQGADQSIKHHLKLKGFADAAKHIEGAGGISKAVGSSKGRRAIGQAIGKALPSAAAGTAYGVGAYKGINAVMGDKPQSQNQAMYNYYGG